MNLKKSALFAALFVSSAVSSFAGYTIRRVDLQPLTLVQGREYTMELFSSGPVLFDNVRLQVTGALADYDIFVGAGIQVGPDEYKVDATGKLLFNIRFHRAPGTVNLTATNTNDGTQFVTVTPTIQRFPVSFQITPGLPTIDANVPFNIQIIAVDALGTFVSAFEDSVQITDSQLGDITPVPGSSFVGGVANVMVNVKAGDMNNQVRLTIDLVGMVYKTPGAQPPATFTTPLLNLVPAAYSKLVMLFPGEVLDPGIGKSGTVITQVANIPVGNVTVWPVDAFYNPIRTSVAMDIHFNSSVGTDVPPADRNLTTPPLQILGGAIDPFIFLTNGTRFITANRVGAGAAEEDVSVVPVAPGASNTYDFDAQQPVGPYTTDDVFTVKITARDTTGAVLTTLFGPLPGATLSARVIGAPTQENVQWVDTNAATLIPDNVVNFAAGVATVNLLVTRRGGTVDLHFQDQYGVGVLSNQFQVNVGALDKIHMTILGTPSVLIGETFTPGTYPGNSGTPPVITAGNQVVVEARLTDRHWNIVSGPAVIGVPIQVDSVIPTTYIVATHPDDPTPTFGIDGELRYQAAPFDKSFRVTVRTAGANRYFRATSNFSASDFLSSSMTINPGSYSRVAFAAPGETLRPGSFYPNGKEGFPATQGAAISFPMTAYLTDSFFNPIAAGPYSNVRFFISPSNPSSFISGVTLGQPVSMPASSRIFTVTLAENSDTRVEDAATPAIFQNVSIPVGPGNVHHFRFTLDNLADKEAGVPFGVTIQAEDEFNQVVTGFNNTITLSATTGAGTMYPLTIALVNGIFDGDLTCFAANAAVRINMVWGSVNSQSAAFRVVPSSLGYTKLLLLGPEEIHRPGTVAGKTGMNAPRQVGTAFLMKALACDPYFNQLASVNGDQVQFQTNSFGQFAPPVGTLAGGEFLASFIMKAAVVHTLTASDLTHGGVAPSTSTTTGKAGTYTRLQVLAPGEVAQPGNEATGGKHPAFPPNQQVVSVSTSIVVRAVDNYFNLAEDALGSNYTGGDVLLVSSPTNSLFLPPNNFLGGPTPRTFVTGSHSRNSLFGDQGFYVLRAFDQNDFTKTFGQVIIDVQPGPVYTFNTPATATAGANFTPVTIRLEMAGTPVAGYNQSVFLSAALPDGTPATGQFNPDGSEREYVMNNGQVVINNLNYQHVETIKIKVRDIFGRIAFSNPIEVQPSGLKYAVFADSIAVAGPPPTFNFRVELRDFNTNTLVRIPAYNHTIGLAAISLLNPTADGTLSASNATLSNGVASLSLAYTKAELIAVQVSNVDLAGWVIVPQNSSAINIRPGTYKKLVLVAPGETHTPGVMASATGKTGTPDSQDRKLGVVFQVRGTDQYWNTVDTFNGGRMHFESTDLDAFLEAPVPQDNPLASGASASLIKFNKAGNIPVTVRDLDDGSIIAQQVVVPVVGTFFEITVPATQNSGTPFSMVVTLKNNLGAIVPSNGPITIDPLLPDGTPATGVLDIRNANLVAGQVTITNQRYTIAEDIRLQVSDGIDNTTNSNVIHFVPRAIFYIYENIPEEGEVNVSFTFRIQAMDADTGTRVKNFNRSNLPLEAFSSVTGLPATGVFVPNIVNLVNGAVEVIASYNRAETIYFRLTDPTTVFDAPPPPTQLYFFSGSSIKINPAPVASIDNAVDFDLLSNEMITVNLVARDGFGNVIPNQRLSLTAEPFGQLSMNSQPDVLNGLTDSNGVLAVTFAAQPFANGLVTVVIHDLDRPDRGFAVIFHVNILGLGRGPARALGLGGNRIPVGYTFDIDVTNMHIMPGGTLRTFYRLDEGPWILYDPAVGATGFDTTKQYTLEWYSEVCYDAGCSNPISELAISGAPNMAMITTYQISDSITGYPSPFNPKARNGDNYLTIQYPLTAVSSVDIDIYDLFGQKVWHKSINAGEQGGEAREDNRVFWYGVNDDGLTVANGGYVVTVKVGSTGQTMKTKVLVVK